MSGTDPFRVVLASDAAIDIGASDMSRYVAERDVDALVFFEGEQPTVYRCRPLTLQERREVRNKATEADRYEAAFVRGLVRVEHLVHPNGERATWIKTDDRSGKNKPIPDSALEAYFDEAAVQEVGMVVWVRSFLARGSQGYFPLPDISRHALTGSLYHRAARMSALSNSATDSANPAEQSAQTTSQASES
jgi:hypothetical protein